MNAANTLLQLISAAVTPVVMISACATLILGVNNKQSGISDRLRAFVAECRQIDKGSERHRQLLAEMAVFHRRFVLSWIAHSALYLAVVCFITTTLTILITQKQGLRLGNGTLVLFMGGIVLMLIAASVELAEIALSARSLNIEMRDIYAEHRS